MICSMASAKGAKMEQKNLSESPTSPHSTTPVRGVIEQPEATSHAAATPDHHAAVGGDDLPRLVELLDVLHATDGQEIPPSVEESLTGLAGLKRLAAAMTIFLTDEGGTEGGYTCEAMANVAPDLVEEFGESFVTALCEEIDEAEIPEQSAVYQRMFHAFNDQYFEGRLPDYRILVVYSVYYWEVFHCGYSQPLLSAVSSWGFIDFRGKQIFMRFLPHSSSGWTMPGILLHEMAHAATDGEHGEDWQSEMSRLKRLGAPVDDLDAEFHRPAEER
jgi:hypothetical protein